MSKDKKTEPKRIKIEWTKITKEQIEESIKKTKEHPDWPAFEESMRKMAKLGD
ncbi:hypothetical protein ACW95P_01750 [Candidatus Mycoplasma pogonae]